MSGHILFLAHRVPWPPDRGDKIRSYHILRKLLTFAPVHLGCFAESNVEAAKPSDVSELLVSKHIAMRTKSTWKAGIEALVKAKPVSLTSFADKAIAYYVKETLTKYPVDCIFVFSGQMAQFIPQEFAGRVVMDFVDVDSAKFESYGNDGGGPMGWINRREGKLLAEFEHTVAQRADCSLFVSQKETELFQKRSGIEPAKLNAVGNGIDFGFYNPDLVEAEALSGNGPVLMFTGQMDYRPNIEAVSSFTNKVMPEIHKQHPDAVFLIVGRAATREVLGLDGKNGAQVIGAVDDVRTWLKAADIVVAPLRIARGIQNKVLEAMAMGKPVIASCAAAEGITAKDGKEFLVARKPSQEADYAVKLINDPKLAAGLSRNARKMVRANYNWDIQLASLADITVMGHETSLMASK